jgi:hypothetical protein
MPDALRAAAGSKGCADGMRPLKKQTASRSASRPPIFPNSLARRDAAQWDEARRQLSVAVIIPTARRLGFRPLNPSATVKKPLAIFMKTAATMNLIARNAVAIFIITAGSNFVLAAPSLAQSPPCQRIRAACKDAGFIQGGPVGDRLIKDCFDPIVQGTRRPDRSARLLPEIAPQLGALCRSDNSGTRPSPEAAAPVLDANAGTSSELMARDGGQTIFDSRLNVTWLADANLAANQTFGVAGINKTGSMNYATAILWVNAMNALDHAAGYLGHSNWQLPTTPATDASCERTGRHGGSFGFNCSAGALGSLYYVSFGLREPDAVVQAMTNTTGPFKTLQPYLY